MVRKAGGEEDVKGRVGRRGLESRKEQDHEEIL
jgi:hypothetical protein